MIHPPLGLNVFVLKGITPDVPIWTIYKGVMPFVAADLIKLDPDGAVPGHHAVAARARCTEVGLAPRPNKLTSIKRQCGTGEGDTGGAGEMPTAGDQRYRCKR